MGNGHTPHPPCTNFSTLGNQRVGVLITRQNALAAGLKHDMGGRDFPGLPCKFENLIAAPVGLDPDVGTFPSIRISLVLFKPRNETNGLASCLFEVVPKLSPAFQVPKDRYKQYVRLGCNIVTFLEARVPVWRVASIKNLRERPPVPLPFKDYGPCGTSHAASCSVTVAHYAFQEYRDTKQSEL
ncbi:hypothetical protein ACRALDRAFT_212251 [Sodiomyces alcalophilus JCM 7366]|uniref:uncharacterized protein n=1 Tax=Sodiomyces alcalophilus JCM 7366 TaxID=591952 RepID=UPI0039B52ACF